MTRVLTAGLRAVLTAAAAAAVSVLMPLWLFWSLR